MSFLKDFFVKIIVFTKMIKKCEFILKWNNSENHHGIIGVLLELTPREIRQKKFKSGVF